MADPCDCHVGRVDAASTKGEIGAVLALKQIARAVETALRDEISRIIRAGQTLGYRAVRAVGKLSRTVIADVVPKGKTSHAVQTSGGSHAIQTVGNGTITLKASSTST